MEWHSEKANDLLSFKTGKLDSNAAEADGKYPFFTCAQETYRINKYAFDTECVLLAGNNAAGIFPLKYYKGKFNAYQRTYIIEPKDRNEINTRYIYESFKLFLKSFEQTSTGATTKFLTMGILNNLWISKPPLPIQHKIAAILSAYDDLIENNNRRIAILEKMAEEIYREWFVRMRFPGHEKAKFHKGVPEGWSICRLKDFGTVITGKTPSTLIREYFDGPCPFIKTPDMHGKMFTLETEETLSQRGMESQPKQAVPENTIFVNCIGALAGAVSITGRLSQTNQQINSLVLKDHLYKEYLYWCIKGLRETIYLFGNTGSTMTNLSKGKFEKLQVLGPVYDLVKEYHAIAEPIFQTIKTTSVKNINIKHSRDLLLSRLITGKLSVEDLEIKFPSSMIEEEMNT